MTSKERAEALYEELTYHSHRPDEVAIIQRAIDEAVAEAVKTTKANAFASAAHIIRQGCGFAPPHGNCDHEDTASAIEGYAVDGIDGMIAALDRLHDERRSTK